MSEPTKKQMLFNKHFETMLKKYSEEAVNNTFNALLLGQMGTGKTYSLLTAPRPLVLHSFDPGGSKSLRDANGNLPEGVYVETFEIEDSNSPTQYMAWERRFNELRRDKFFDNVGTFAIDSITTFTGALMNMILKKGNRPGTPPQLQDYMQQMIAIMDIVKVCASLPCNFVAIGHIVAEKDEVTGRMQTFPMITGQLKEKLPTLFDEVYVATVAHSRTGPSYKFRTIPDGYYQARSRLAASGKLEELEEPNFKHILKKTGYPYTDLWKRDEPEQQG